MTMYGIVPLAVFVFTFAFLFRFDFRKYFRRYKWREMNEEGTGGEAERLRGSEGHGEQLRAKETVTMGAVTESLENSSKLEDQSEEDLVPGLPNEITMDLIVTKLPWRAFHSLSSVSRSWRHVIRSRRVYDARVRSNSTETLFAFEQFIDGDNRAIFLYSMRDDSWHQLPPVPRCPRGTPFGCACISLEGKLYVIGGDNNRREDGSREVYALDLVEQREWKQCASMRDARLYCASGVVGGKICAFGGISFLKRISRSEIYDPKENVWSSIRPMNAKPFGHYVLNVEEELFVCGGFFDTDDGNYPDEDDFARMANGPNHPTFYGFFSEVYHPGKDEWRLVAPLGWCEFRRFFMAEGELHAMTFLDIRVTDIESGDNSWTVLHSCLFPGLEATKQEHIRVYHIYAVNGELLALVDWPYDHPHRSRRRLVKSKGFRSGNANIVWEVVSSPLSFKFIHFNMCPIQL